VNKDADPGPVLVAWWRFLLLAATVVALYFTIRAVSESDQTHPALLVPGIVLGAAVGVLVGRREAASLQASERIGNRGPGSRRPASRSAARSAVVGLAGCGLLLAQVLSTGGMEWVLLGGVAVMVGGAGHAWVVARHYERVEIGLGD
jgi:peptidoglycan/LPS O-acetylase OafA/YrhL